MRYLISKTPQTQLALLSHASLGLFFGRDIASAELHCELFNQGIRIPDLELQRLKSDDRKFHSLAWLDGDCGEVGT